MKRVDADFTSDDPPPLWLWLLLAVAFVALGWSATTLLDERALARRQLEALRSTRDPTQRQRAPPPPAGAAYAESAARMLHEREAPWPALLQALEQSLPVGVTVQTLALDAAGADFGRVSLIGSNAALLLQAASDLDGSSSIAGLSWRVERFERDAAGPVARVELRVRRSVNDRKE